MTVVITGASTGIGRALALRWAARGATLVLAARGKAALEGVAHEVERAGARALVEAGDVTDESFRRHLVARAEREGGIDVLVNNAGRGFYAPTLNIDVDELRRLFELNTIAPLHLVQLAAPQLERSHGTIVMMSSIAGVVAAPRYGAYAASKFALEALAMAMRSELAAQNIRVVVVRPGPVATPFRTNATRAPGESSYLTPDPKAQSPDAVAEITIRAVERAKAIAETSPFVRFTSAASRLAPRAVRFALGRMAQRSHANPS